MMRAPTDRPRATPNPPRATRKRQSLIGNGMHSRASTTALQCATSLFLIGNEFHVQRVSQTSPTLTNRAWGTRKKQVPACPSRWPSSKQGRRDDNHRARYMRQVTARENSPISNHQVIHCPELDTGLTCTKHPLGIVSNRQFFALLKLADTSNAGQSSRRRNRWPGQTAGLAGGGGAGEGVGGHGGG